jgi:phosphomannomutase
MSVKKLLERLYSEVGRYITKRENITLSQEIEAGFAGKMHNLPSQFAGIKVKDIITLDGTKCIMEDGSWLLFRKSGTEPVVRLYGEASSEDALNAVIAAGKKFIFS